MISREQIAYLVPGGVPDTSEAARLVSELVTLVGESPEVDVDSANDTMTRAARAIFAMHLLIADGGAPGAVATIDGAISRARRHMATAEGLDAANRMNQGVGSPEFYSGVLEGLQSLRKNLTGEVLDGPRNA